MPLAIPGVVKYLLGPGSSWRDVFGAVLDCGVVAFLVYRVLLLIRGTRAINVLVGLFVLGIGYLGSQWANLVTLNWLLGHFLSYSFIFGVIVLFQADIRRGLAHLGRGRFLRALAPDERREQAGVVEAVARAALELAQQRRGALVVIERVAELSEVVETGVRVDAALSTELLVALFQPGGPLHDGAVVVRRGRLAAGRCLLPLTAAPQLRDVGTRHRAALGLAEEVDAVVVVVSEERGEISLAVDGAFHRRLDEGALRDRLATLLVQAPQKGMSAFLARLGLSAPGGDGKQAEKDRAAV
jgi:diadenylate cyclase